MSDALRDALAELVACSDITIMNGWAGASEKEDALRKRWALAWAAARAALAQPAEPVREPVAGWRLVPVDPTDAMVDATHHGQPVDDIYRDMIAAAPPAPQPPLTDEQIDALHCDHVRIIGDQIVGLHVFARAVIAEYERIKSEGE